MAREYRTVDTNTLKGLRTAERLHQAGWKQDFVGLSVTRFYRDKPRKVRKPQPSAGSPEVWESLGM